MPSRIPPDPMSMSSPDWTMGRRFGSGALGTLKFTNEKVSPASSDSRILMKSMSELLNCTNGTYNLPVDGSTYGVENCREFCGCVGSGSVLGAKIVLVVQVAPPSNERPNRSCTPDAWKLVQVT